MSDDDLRYENLDDEQPYPEEEIEAIDLDALDDAIEPEDQPDEGTASILASITTLDDEIEPAKPKKSAPAHKTAPLEPAVGPAVEIQPEPEAAPAELPTPAPIDLEALDDVIEAEAGSETQPDEETADILEAITTLDDEIVGDESETVAPEAEAEAAVETETPAQEEPAAETPLEPAPLDLDVLDDVIEAEAGPEVQPDEKTEDILEAITTLDDEIEPAAEQPAEPEEPAAPPDWIYRVLIAVPAEMSQEMIKLRKLGEISDMPEPGFELIAPFRAEDPAAVQAALKSWARNHLPLQLEVTGVEADVLGARDYVAAWTLLPGDDLDETQADLVNTLSPLVTFVPDTPEKPPLRVIVGQKVAPVPFPRLVARMQRDFEPYVWHAETANLVRQEADSTTWESIDSYR